MREDFTFVLSKHNGHLSYVIGEVMAEKGIDEEIYHKGAVVGNGCMNFAKKGQDIVGGIDTETKNIIISKKGITYLDALATSLKATMTPLYNIMHVMKLFKRQKQKAIDKFEDEILAMNRAIKKFMVNVPIPGTDIELPTFLKSHFMFDGHLTFLKRCYALGGFDEQNI